MFVPEDEAESEVCDPCNEPVEVENDKQRHQQDHDHVHEKDGREVHAARNGFRLEARRRVPELVSCETEEGVS